jgi:putative phage repressor|nr:MAG TPA: Repressor protein CI [Caudoviricetes sp.]
MLKIKEIRESKNITQDELVSLTGIPKRSFVNYENGITDIPFSKLQNIATVLNVSISELAGETKSEKNTIKKNDGKNDGENDEKPKVKKTPSNEDNPYIIENLPTNRKTMDSIHEIQEVPLYDLEATAGLQELFSGGKSAVQILDTIKIPHLPKCDGAISITGDSMYPLLKSGDMVLYKEIPLDSIFYGEMYLLSYKIDDWEEYVTVKYVQKSDLGDEYLKLVSQNQHHQPKDVLKAHITAIAIIKASIRINTMM